jgi:chromosome segregation ATPase
MNDTPETNSIIRNAQAADHPPTRLAATLTVKCEKLERERDEARDDLKHITEYGTDEINAAVELRQKLAQALVDLDNMQDQRDFAMKVIKRLEQERDEAREKAERYRLDANALMLQRDEAQEEIKRLKVILDLIKKDVS